MSSSPLGNQEASRPPTYRDRNPTPRLRTCAIWFRFLDHGVRDVPYSPPVFRTMVKTLIVIAIRDRSFIVGSERRHAMARAMKAVQLAAETI